MQPADVYLCSVKEDEDEDEDNDDHDGPCTEEMFDGSQELARDLHQLDGGDPYVVGAANIGKRTSPTG